MQLPSPLGQSPHHANTPAPEQGETDGVIEGRWASRSELTRSDVDALRSLAVSLSDIADRIVALLSRDG